MDLAAVCVAEPSAAVGSVIVTAASYERDRAAIRAIRFTVFVDEQSVPASLEMDDRDPLCFHVLAHTADGAVVGTGRVDVDATTRTARVGRMAVLADYRGCGVGARLLAALHEHARLKGCLAVWCHAQIAAQGFYERAGYSVEGEPFEEAGIAHITMRRRL